MIPEFITLEQVILVTVIFIGYVPMAIAHWRHNIPWMFSAYTVLVATFFIWAIGDLYDQYLGAVISLTVAISGILFFASAHFSEKAINELEETVREQTIDLEEDNG